MYGKIRIYFILTKSCAKSEFLARHRSDELHLSFCFHQGLYLKLSGCPKLDKNYFAMQSIAYFRSVQAVCCSTDYLPTLASSNKHKLLKPVGILGWYYCSIHHSKPTERPWLPRKQSLKAWGIFARKISLLPSWGKLHIWPKGNLKTSINLPLGVIATLLLQYCSAPRYELTSL